jgi:hypothetical protein
LSHLKLPVDEWFQVDSVTLTGRPGVACPADPPSNVTLKAIRPPVQKASLAGVLLSGTPAAAGRLGQADERILKAALGVCAMPPDADVHLVLCRFGRAGLAYVEADPAASDASAIVRNLLYGQYGHPLRVVAMNADEGWCRDVSDVMADKVREVAQREDIELTDGTLAFLEAHEPEVKQAMLPLW